MKHQAMIIIPGNHPALPGHFPGEPVVPGVVILDEIRKIVEKYQSSQWVFGVARVKFTAPLFADEPLTVNLEFTGSECHFGCFKGERLVTQGVFELAATV